MKFISKIAVMAMSFVGLNACNENPLLHATTATGFTAVTLDDVNGQRRFWVSLDPDNRTWTGGHTAPSTGVLPVASGKYILTAGQLILRDSSSNAPLLHVLGFSGLTNEGDTGRGNVENPPSVFAWTAIR